MDKKCGIYSIENIANNKKYVGQSIDIDRRWKEHSRALSKNIHFNQYLQRSYNKYGKKNFRFNIIEECTNNLLDERETYFIKILHSHVSENGYNISWGGDYVPKNCSIARNYKRINGKKLSKFPRIKKIMRRKLHGKANI